MCDVGKQHTRFQDSFAWSTLPMLLHYVLADTAVGSLCRATVTTKSGLDCRWTSPSELM
jgi:hypothetical protein